jgi:uncharacterized protein (DUF1800 family)
VLVDEVAAVFLRTDGDLRATVMAIFTSPFFWSDDARAAKTKTPLEFVASSVRAVGTLQEVKQPLARVLDQMGEPLYRCNPPTGFAEKATPWVNAGALVNRINFGLALAAGRIPGVSVTLPAEGATPAETLDRLSAAVLGGPLSPQTRQTVLQALGGEEADGELRKLSTAKVAGLLIGSPEFQHQ